MKKIIHQVVLRHCMIVLLLLCYEALLAQEKEFAGKNITEQYQNNLGKYLRKYTVYSLDVKNIASYVQANSQNARLILNLFSEKFKLAI